MEDNTRELTVRERRIVIREQIATLEVQLRATKTPSEFYYEIPNKLGVLQQELRDLDSHPDANLS